MKTNKILSLDSDLVEKLREEANGSALVNKLLREHYDRKDFSKMSTEELEVFIASEEAKKAYNERLKEIESGKLE